MWDCGDESAARAGGSYKVSCCHAKASCRYSLPDRSRPLSQRLHQMRLDLGSGPALLPRRRPALAAKWNQRHTNLVPTVAQVWPPGRVIVFPNCMPDVRSLNGVESSSWEEDEDVPPLVARFGLMAEDDERPGARSPQPLRLPYV
jgi:hypothetical protein